MIHAFELFAFTKPGFLTVCFVFYFKVYDPTVILIHAPKVYAHLQHII